MKKNIIISFLHVILLLLASTEFRIIQYITRGYSFYWDYWTYSYRNGFGHTFESHYSLLEIFAYIGAYVTGMILFVSVQNKGLTKAGSLGFVVCAVGLVSFLIEGSHWIFNHHLSWIASFPIVVILLWFIIIACLFKRNKHEMETELAAREI